MILTKDDVGKRFNSSDSDIAPVVVCVHSCTGDGVFLFEDYRSRSVLLTNNRGHSLKGGSDVVSRYEPNDLIIRKNKAEDIFKLPLKTGYGSKPDAYDLCDKLGFISEFSNIEKANMAAHAINNHDSLIALARYVSTTLPENSHNGAVAKRMAKELLDKIKGES